jgi:hypothetical protein
MALLGSRGYSFAFRGLYTCELSYRFSLGIAKQQIVPYRRSEYRRQTWQTKAGVDC